MRVIGHMRSFGNQRKLQAFHVRPVTDHNEITYHTLQALYEYLKATKGVVGKVSRSIFAIFYRAAHNMTCIRAAWLYRVHRHLVTTCRRMLVWLDNSISNPTTPCPRAMHTVVLRTALVATSTRFRIASCKWCASSASRMKASTFPFFARRLRPRA